jgi:hypothetical protein
MTRMGLSIVAIATAMAPMATSLPVAADQRGAGKITACSTYGRHGCVTARVRMTRLGPQYRSPGGNWIWCEVDCRDTLRRDTIDFWDDQRERSK